MTYDHSGPTRWWLDVARWGQPLIQRGVMLGIALILALRAQGRVALWLVGRVIAENVIAPTSKFLLNKPRPTWDNPITIEHSMSYPSGHATAAACFGLATLLVVPLVTASRPTRVILVIGAFLATITISADRIFLGVRYLTDVVVGVLLGSLMTLTSWQVIRLFHHPSGELRLSAELNRALPTTVGCVRPSSHPHGRVRMAVGASSGQPSHYSIDPRRLP